MACDKPASKLSYWVSEARVSSAHFGFAARSRVLARLVSLAQIGEHDILERKSAFLSYKNKNFKKSKNWHFSKGVNPWFWSKNGHFSNFFFTAI